jgi:predicted nucleic acid-binding protein
MIVVDTNVVSELMKAAPSAHVHQWVMHQYPGEPFTTSITVVEILYRIERLAHGQRKDALRSAASDVFNSFTGQVLPFDGDAATAYSVIVDLRERRGLPIDGFEAQIAAICSVRQATLATRNVKDFEHTGIEVVDPWDTRGLRSLALTKGQSR